MVRMHFVNLPRMIKSAIVARRQSKRSAEEVFSEVYKRKYWGGDDEHFSGYGSHVQSAIDAYKAALSEFAKDHPDSRVVDIGCGDFNMGRHTRHLFGPYIACDVVSHIIERNEKVFSDLDVKFRQLDITMQDPPDGDVALIRQVFQHLSNKQISEALGRLSKFKFLIVTEHLPVGDFVPNADKAQGAGVRAHQRIPSGIVLTEPPFHFVAKSSRILGEIIGESEILRTMLYETVAS
jgi:SAM-dependent methyltransferase